MKTTKQERLQVTVPANNEWHTEDLEKKAEKLRMDKNEFIFNAIDLFYNLDVEVHKQIISNANSLKVPEYIFIQNMIIDILAKSAAEYEVYGINKSKMLPQFMFVDDDKGFRVITGKELFDELKRMEVEKIKAEQRKIKVERENQHNFNMKMEELIFKATGIEDHMEQAEYFENMKINDK